MIRTALLSRWHVHADEYAAEAMRHPDMEVVAVWDEKRDRGRQWAKELGVPFVAELDSVMSDPNIDAVIITTPTTMHHDVILAAAKHGKHVFTEKVMAATVAECLEMLAALEDNGCRFMISLPRLSAPYFLYAAQAVKEGLLGTITSLRCRVAHDGALQSETAVHGWLPDHFYDRDETAGGALIDLGAHPIYLANRLLGKPLAVMARLLRFSEREVDDNAFVLSEYGNGAVAVLETGFVSRLSPFWLELSGTQGTLIIEDDNLRIRSTEVEVSAADEGMPQADELQSKRRRRDWPEWVTPELPEPGPRPMSQWVDAILNRHNPDISYDDALNLTLVNEAAALAHEKGCRIVIQEHFNV